MLKIWSRNNVPCFQNILRDSLHHCIVHKEKCNFLFSVLSFIYIMSNADLFMNNSFIQKSYSVWSIVFVFSQKGIFLGIMFAKINYCFVWLNFVLNYIFNISFYFYGSSATGSSSDWGSPDCFALPSSLRMACLSNDGSILSLECMLSSSSTLQWK